MQYNIFSQVIGRRTFLRGTSLVAVGMSAQVLKGCDKSDPGPGNCRTTDDILGPFYKAGAPFRENIVPPGSPGTPLIVTGTVHSDCEQLVAGAVIEIWNADDSGTYDASEDFRFRGRSLTAADGRYTFRTIVPGRYLNGSVFRPSHIHFRITAEGHAGLVSQIYFRDDPFISSDPWASSEKASERILTINKDINGVDTVTFDIYLQSST